MGGRLLPISVSLLQPVSSHLHHQHVRLWGDEASETQLDSGGPGAHDAQDALFQRQLLTHREAGQVGGQLQGQLTDRLRARIRTAEVARRRALAQFLHALRVVRAVERHGFAVSVRIALPAFHADPVGDLLDRRRLRVVRVVHAPVPHIPFAEPEDDAVAGLVDADRQIAVAEQQPSSGTRTGWVTVMVWLARQGTVPIRTTRPPNRISRMRVSFCSIVGVPPYSRMTFASGAST